MSFGLRMGFAGAMALALLAVPAAAPAFGQTPRAPIQVALVEGEAGVPVTVLGDVRAEIHQKSMMPKTPSRDLANQELQKQAAKLGADAVVNIKYENYNAMFSKKGFVASGKAVKFVTPPPQPQFASVPPALASQPSFSATGLPSPIPAPVAPPPAQSAQILPAPAPVAPPVAAPPAAAPAPAAVAAPAAAGVVMLSEQNIARAYTVMGPISAEVTTASLNKTGRELLDDELRAQAKKLGADAVVLIKYSPAGPGKGLSAIGVAVKLQ